jgi:DNA polymerase sigma
MIHLTSEQLDVVRKILLQVIPDAQVYVFGSRSSSTTKPHSDIDLCIDTRKKLEISTLSQLKQEFEESDLPFRVDLVDWHQISDDFKTRIQADWERIQ